MLKTIIYREFLSNIITFRFLLGLLICVGLVGANTYVLMRGYEGKLQSYQLAVQAHTDEIRNIQVYSELSLYHRPKVDKKPRLMSILNEGVEGRFGNSVEVSYNIVPTTATQIVSDNPYLVVFRKIDLSLVFQIVISLLAFLFAYDAVAGERENGTLALSLSNSIPRSTLLLGKYLGGMLSLVVPLALSLIVALQIILLSPYAAISASDWARIGLFCLVSLIYVSVFFTLGMLFSSCSRRSATALMFAMFFWVVFVLVWPSASIFVVSKLAPLKSDSDINWGVAMEARAAGKKNSEHPLLDLWQNQFEREVNNYVKQHNVPTHFNGEYLDMLNTGVIMYGSFSAPPEKLPIVHEYMKFKEELRIRYTDKVDQMWDEYLNQNPIRQAKLAQNIARISPAAAYSDATAILAETDLGRQLQFFDQAKQYRLRLIQYLRDQNAFGSETWYSQEAGKKIDKEGIPLFQEHAESLLSSLKRASVSILLLVLLNVAFFLLTFTSFLKYDVR